MANFSYLYVLVSKPGDTYYEQTLVSVISLRFHMPNAKIVLLVDDTTDQSLKGNREEIKNFVTCVKSVGLPESLSNMQKSRWLKTSMYEYVDEDCLYIDSDTIIMESLEAIENDSRLLAASIDKHMLLSSHCNKSLIEANAARVNYSPAINDKHFNSGVILIRKDPLVRDFFLKWHECWKHSMQNGVNVDQIALGQANHLSNGLMGELSGIWNCQIEYGMKFINHAKIWHMFVTGDKFDRRPHIFMDPSFYKKIESTGITNDVMEIIRNPWMGFKAKTQLVGGSSVDYFNTYLSRLCCLLFCFSPTSKKLFRLLDIIAKKIIKK